jgi:hypothetical protein
MKNVLLAVMTCAVLLASFTSVFAQTTPEINIVKPGDRRNMGLGENQVTVEITGIDPKLVTWQVLIDGDPLATVTDGSLVANVDVPKPTGPRRIRAVMYDAQNNEISRDEILVIAAPIDIREPVFSREGMAQAMGVFVVFVIVLLIVAWFVSRRVRNEPIHSIPGTKS